MKKPILPHYGYGLIEEGGLYFTLPMKGMSLNIYRDAHHKKKAKYKSGCITLISPILYEIVKQPYLNISREAIGTKEPLFSSAINLEWIATFGDKRIRDVPNNSQKILLDAIVSMGIIEDDNEKFLLTEKTMFGHKEFDSVTCLLLGETKPLFKSSTQIIGLNDLYKKMGVM